MKRLILVSALICLALANNCTQPKGSSCDQNVLKCCDSNFKSKLDLKCNNKPIYENPDCLESAVSSYFNDSSSAFALCDAFNEFRSCLDSTTRSCTSLKHFLESGLPVLLAQTDEGIYDRLSFLCGAGLDSYLRNVDTFVPIFVDHFRDIQLCMFKFRVSIRRNPEDACLYLQEYVGCVEFVFIDSKEMTWFMCETARAYGKPLAPLCDVSCSSNA